MKMKKVKILLFYQQTASPDFMSATFVIDIFNKTFFEVQIVVRFTDWYNNISGLISETKTLSFVQIAKVVPSGVRNYIIGKSNLTFTSFC